MAAKALTDVQLQYQLPAGLKLRGAPVFDPRSDLKSGLNPAWDGSARHGALLQPDLALEAGRRIIVRIPLQVSPDAVESHIDSSIEAAAGNVDGTARATHALKVVPDKATGGALQLKTRVDKRGAEPGETLAYTIEFMNRSDQPLHELTIREIVPAHTTLIPRSAVCKQIPAALVCRVATPDRSDSDDAGRQIRWEFTGDLPPGEQGSVGFKVRVER